MLSEFWKNVLSSTKFILLMTIVFGVGLFAYKNHQRDLSCYEGHVIECEQCHSQNLTYALCSGFCFPTRIDEDKYWCSFPPSRNCTTMEKVCNFPPSNFWWWLN
jgi:hypothetical protein